MEISLKQKLLFIYFFWSSINQMRTKNIDMWKLDPNWKFAS